MTDIQITDLVDGSIVNNEWAGTGVFDKLIQAVNANIEVQYRNSRINGQDYANVYLGSIQAVLSQAVQYTLQEKLTEAQIEGIIADNALKAKQLEIAEKELAIKEYQLVNIQPAELAQLQKQTDVAERGMVEQEATGSKQRLILDEDKKLKAYENTVLQVDQHNKLVDDLLTSEKQRDLVSEQIIEVQERVDMVEQQTLTEVQNTARVSYEVSTLLPDQHATNIKQQTLLDSEEEAKQYEIDFLLPKQLEKATADVSMLSKQEDLIDSQIVGSGYDNEVKAEQVLMSVYERTNVQPKQLEKLESDIGVNTQQVKNLYTEQVIKDKEAARLGLDNTVKVAEGIRASDPSYVYEPQYKEI